jgi:hypothetical protein
MAAPLYAIEVKPPQATPFEVTPERAPEFGRAYGRIGAALGAFGEAVSTIGESYQKQHTETQVAEAKIATMRGNYAIQKQATENPDYNSAPQQYGTNANDLVEAQAATIADANERTRFRQWAASQTLSGQKNVENYTIKRQTDVNVSQLNQEAVDTVARAAAAATPEERIPILQNFSKSVDAKVESQWITQQAGDKLKQAVSSTLDERDAKDLVQKDPAAAMAALDSPEQFPTLGPLQRQALKAQARNLNDHRVSHGMSIRAQVDPAGAAATVGMTTTAQQSEPVFRQGVVAIEGGIREGRGLISPKGALGMTQVLPGTARDMLFKFANDTGDDSYRQLAQLPDAQLRELLLNNHNLNYQLGREYWFVQMKTFNNNIAAAAAAYNAGPGKAKEWVAEANLQFGPNWTAAQFVSVIPTQGPYAETHHYVRNLYKKLGADMNGAGLSPEGQFAAATTVQTVLARDAAEQTRIIKDVAAGQRAIHDPTKLIVAGVVPEETARAQWVLTQTQAAAAGDPVADKALREYRIAEGVEPAIQRMQRRPVAESEAMKDAFVETAHRVGTTDAFKAAEMVKTAFEATRQAAHANPVGLAERTGIAPLTSINPDAQPSELGAQLAGRAAIAVSAADFYKVGRKPFKPEEVAALKERFAQSVYQKQAQLLTAMATSLGPAYQAGIEQLGLDATMQEAGKIALRNPELAEQVLRGHELLKQSHISVAAEPVREVLKAKLGQDMFGAAQQERAIKAALALYTARQGDRVALYSATDQAGIEKALQEIIGEVRTRNGINVPTPPGMTTGRFDSAWTRMNSDDLNAFGGAFDNNGRPHDPRDLNRRALLKPVEVGSSDYMVLLPSTDGRGNTVHTYDGGALVINVNELEARQAKRLGFGSREEMERAGRRLTVGQAMREGQRAGLVAPPEVRREAELRALKRREEGLEASGLGGVFLDVQRRRIAAERERLGGPQIDVSIPPPVY